jgi:hypothetical protein
MRVLTTAAGIKVQMKIRTMCCISFLLPLALWPQVWQKTIKGEDISREYQQQQEVGDLYKRVSASRFVVIASVVSQNIVSQRGAPPSIDSNIGGMFYTLAVEDTLCRQEDFGPSATPNLSRRLTDVQIFVPYMPPARGKEHLVLGQRYLLFLVEPERKQQKEWTHAFDLNPDHVYFRGDEMARGVIRLEQPTASNPKPMQPQVLEKVTRLCEALQPPELPKKLIALNQLAASNNPVLRKEAQEALIALQSAWQ